MTRDLILSIYRCFELLHKQSHNLLIWKMILLEIWQLVKNSLSNLLSET